MATPNLGFDNFFETTLSGDISASDTVIPLNDVPVASEGYLVLEPTSTTDREIIYYTSKGVNSVTCPSAAAGRGVGGTSAISHNSGDLVRMNVVAEHFEALQDGTAFAAGGIGASAYADGWIPWLGVTPDTITANGNRNYDIVFNGVDHTSTLSPGMKLQLTRTVAAPDQCADLEASSSQYFSKSSPTGVSFTNTWTVSAWVKLESYSTSTIVSSGSSDNNGWSVYIDTSGRINSIFRGALTTYKNAISYASLPLNKWVHVAVAHTANAHACVMYIDGISIDVLLSVSGGTPPTSVTQAGNLYVGSNRVGTETFDGKLAQVALYSAIISQATIKASMNQALSGSETSLISAYSLDNSLNDLSANANNLTANGGAAATDTDSPFANAVSAGLLEYAEVNSVTFSTNTTVNVRVPDTCMIPTSGGVSAVSYSTQSNAYGLPYFSKVLGEVMHGSDQISNSNTVDTDINGMSLSVYIPSGACVRLTASENMGTATASTLHIIKIKEGSAQIVESGFQETTSALRGQIIASKTFYPTAGSHTYKVMFYSNQNANTTLYGSGGSGSGQGASPVFRVELV